MIERRFVEMATLGTGWKKAKLRCPNCKSVRKIVYHVNKGFSDRCGYCQKKMVQELE